MGYYSKHNNNIILSSVNRDSRVVRIYNVNKKISEVFINKCWLNKPCFIIGGGESIQGFDFSLLKNYLTIGINKTFKYYLDATLNYGMDIFFYNKIYKDKELLSKWLSFKGHKIFLTPTSNKQFKDIYLVRRRYNKEIQEDINLGIYGGSNSGTGALMLAATLGADPIYLLGYDMQAINKTHWHEGYDNRKLEEFNIKLKSYANEIDSLAPILMNRGIKVYNLNFNSALKCFRFLTLEKALYDCKNKHANL